MNVFFEKWLLFLQSDSHTIYSTYFYCLPVQVRPPIDELI